MSLVQQRQKRSYLVVFDFDHTVVDCNSDVTVMTTLGKAEEQQRLMDDRMQWTDMCSQLLESFSKEEIQEAVRTSIVADPKMIEVFELLKAAKDNKDGLLGGVEVAVASDANTLFISETFDSVFPASTRGVVDSIHSNPIRFFSEEDVETDGKNKKCEVNWYAGRSGHDCVKCNEMQRYNMCKSCIVQSLLQRTSLIDPIIIFIGDGSNDHCPSQRVLRTRDYLFPRRGMALASRLQKPGGAGICKKLWWSSPADLLDNFSMVLDLENRAPQEMPSLPPRFLFHDGGDQPFRAKTLATRMPALIDRTIESNMERWSKEFPVGDEGTATASASSATMTLRCHLLNTLKNSVANNTTIAQLLIALCEFPTSVTDDKNKNIPLLPPQHESTLIAELRTLVYNSWLRTFDGDDKKPAAVSVSSFATVSWGDLPWLEGEVYFNILVVVFCHALVPSSEADVGLDEETAEPTPTKFLRISPVVESVLPIILDVEHNKTAANATDNNDAAVTTRFSHVFQAIVEDVYAVEKAASVNTFLESHIVPMVKVPSSAATTATANANPLDWRRFSSLPAILHQSLWGNAVDLSMFHLNQLKQDHHHEKKDGKKGDAPTTFDDDKMIVANHISEIAAVIEAIFENKQKKNSTNNTSSVVYFDIIQDNVGVECAADLLLALCLIEHAKQLESSSSSFTLRVRLHVKPMPHYVSDTMRHDLEYLVKAIKAHGGCEEFVAAIETALSNGKKAPPTAAAAAVASSGASEEASAPAPSSSSSSGIEVHTDPFWISPGEFRTMPPQLARRFFFTQRIKKNKNNKDSTSSSGSFSDPTFEVHPLSDFVLVKGDLNFRRLVGDRHWESASSSSATATTTATFAEAVKDYWPIDAVPIAALRTLKSEVNVGPTAEKIAALDATEVKDSWRVSGKHGVALIAHKGSDLPNRTTRGVGLFSLVVADYDEAITFYTKALRFDLVQDLDMGDKRWVVVAPPCAKNGGGGGGASIVLAEAKNEEEESRIGNQLGGRVGFFLETSNFQDDLRHMRQHGVRFLESPRYEVYGTVAVFQDLYGNKWDLLERPKE